MSKNVIMINRAPVLTLWAAVVAERLGYDADAALTLGKCVAALTAQTKGRMLGIYGPPKAGPHGDRPKKTGLGEDFWIQLCGRGVPAKSTPEGVRAVVKDKPIDPAAVAKYLTQKFGDGLDAAREAMAELAAAFVKMMRPISHQWSAEGGRISLSELSPDQRHRRDQRLED